MLNVGDEVIIKSTLKHGEITQISYDHPKLFLVKHGETWRSYEMSELTTSDQLAEVENDDVRTYIAYVIAALFIFIGSFVIIKTIVDTTTLKGLNVYSSINR